MLITKIIDRVILKQKKTASSFKGLPTTWASVLLRQSSTTRFSFSSVHHIKNKYRMCDDRMVFPSEGMIVAHFKSKTQNRDSSRYNWRTVLFKNPEKEYRRDTNHVTVHRFYLVYFSTSCYVYVIRSNRCPFSRFNNRMLWKIFLNVQNK